MTPRERTLADIGLIALRHGLTRYDILGHDRRSHVVAARAEAACYLRDKGRSYPEIGRDLGNRHHTTIMNLIHGKRHPLKRIKNGQFAKTANYNSAAPASDHAGT